MPRPTRSRLIILNRYFYPDHSATSQIMSDLAFYLGNNGFDVHVITSRQRYDDPHATLPPHARVNGIHIHRLKTSRLGRGSLLGRALEYVLFYAATYRQLGKLTRPSDVIVASTDPPLIAVVAMLTAGRRNAHLINWIQDLYPEVAMRLNVPLCRGLIGKCLMWVRDRSLNKAFMNVTVGELMATHVISRGVARRSVQVIPNWVKDAEILPVGHDGNPLRNAWGLDDKFVIGYSGNLGRAHEIETILATADLLRNDPSIVFLFIGGGHLVAELIRRVDALGLRPMFRFFPYQDRSVLRYSLGTADVHWISLRAELEGLIVPSKFYGVAAAGRPAIVVSAPGGELARLVADHACGLAIAPGQAAQLAAALRRLKRDPAALAAMGQQARRMLDRLFTRKSAFERWRQLFERVDEINVHVASEQKVVTPTFSARNSSLTG
jgi:colanic acid biosynthesis glycosyl transferase WcaI